MNSPSNNSTSNSSDDFTIDADLFLRNCKDFTARFPDQAAILGLDHPEAALRRLRNVPPEYRLVQAKAQGERPMPTLAMGGSFLHSRYNPLAEAQRILHSEFFQTDAVHRRCIFVGLGLGYLVSQYIEQFPKSQAVVIEADLNVFLCFLAACPCGSFFRHSRLSMLVGTEPEQAVSFLASTGWTDTVLCKAPASIAAYKSWYDTFFELLERNAMKNSINAKTLERFGSLWLKNTVKNLAMLCTAAKINAFKDAFPDTVAVVLAGGPSLTEHLELIKKSSKDFLIIAVDTAVRACLRAGVIPDFILSFDPQYWNYLHMAGLDMSRSFLISEASVFPAVLRTHCRALFLAHSSTPFARYLAGMKEGEGDCTLAAGGSVATTAWDLARYMGARTIIMAGLDLAYPQLQTHFVGSTFEEAVHKSSGRLAPAEQAAFKSLYSAFPSLHEDYAGNLILTDRRMLLYAWWFENAMVQYPSIKTYNLVPQGLRIKGMAACSAHKFTALARSLPRTEIEARLDGIVKKAYEPAFFDTVGARKSEIAASVMGMARGAAELAREAGKAEAISRRLSDACAPCASEYRGRAQGGATKKIATLRTQLDRIDEKIKNGFAKDLVAVLFAGEVQGGDAHAVQKATQDTSQNSAETTYERIRRMAEKVYEILTKQPLDIIFRS